MIDIAVLVVSVAICFAAAGLGGIPTARGLRQWYPALAKPAWNPPNWVFGPVWSLLYLLMAIAAWLVWRERDVVAVGLPLALFGAQLAANVLWSWMFFGRRDPRGAVGVIVALWILIAATGVAFAAASTLAAWLLVPYLAWVSFATALNVAIARLNPGPRPA